VCSHDGEAVETRSGTKRVTALPARLWSSAWSLLVLVNLFWAGNVILGRAIAGSVPPVTLAFWRWTGAFILTIGLAWRLLKRDWPELRRHWPMMLLLSATGIASFNTMSYIGLQYTTALNALLLQSATPLFVLLWAFAIYGERPSALQAIGVFVSLLGIAVIASAGSLDKLLHLSVNPGDVWILVAVVIYAVYSPLLRRRPAVHPLSFLVAAMGIGSLMMLPFYILETMNGATITGGWTSYAAMAYTMVLPSFVAYFFFNRAVELVGAARAGHSAHLMPVFGTLLAVLFLGERFHSHHLAGIGLIALGILLASMSARTSL
jgi:drug/metabolite transporter (DMT)-like permease